MISTSPFGPRGRRVRARWSVPASLVALAIALGGCISVTPAPGSGGPSTVPVATPSAAAPTQAAAEPTREPSAPSGTLLPGRTPRATASPTPRPTPPATPTAAPSASQGAAGSSAPPSAAPATVTAGAPASPGTQAPGSEAPGASPLPTPTPGVTAPVLTPGPPRDRALASTEVYGFLPYWEMGKADTLDLSQLTTLAYFGVEANARGNLIRQAGGVDTPGWAGFNGETWRDLQARAQAAGVRTVLTIQRFSWTDSQRRRTIRLFSDPAARMRLSDQVMALVTERGLDGVNLDVEPLPAEVSADFTQFVRELRAAMNAVDPTLQLTFDVMPGVENYDIAALTAEDAADALFVMGYEYLTGAAARTGSNAPLVSVTGPRDLTGDVANILASVDPSVVILGLPWYGRAWSTTSPQPHADTRSGARWPVSVTINYDDAILQAARTGRLYDEVEQSAWSLYPSKLTDCQACRVTWRQLWYDDVDATRAKVDFALEQQLRGVGFWALGYQGAGPEMWSVLRMAIGGATDDAPPSGSADLDPGSVTGQRQGLPVVGPRVRLLLTAQDGEGSGPAFVRVSLADALDADGQLADGTTFPVSDAVTVDLTTGGPAYDLATPRPARPRKTPAPTPSPPAGTSASAAPGAPSTGAPPSPSAEPAPTSGPSSVPSVAPSAPSEPTPSGKAGRRTIRVQWRDVAGNWSAPLAIDVFLRPGARPQATPTPLPSVSPTQPPVLPVDEPDPEDAASPAPDLSPPPA